VLGKISVLFSPQFIRGFLKLIYWKERKIMKTRNHYLILAAVLTILSTPALAKQAPSLPEDLPRPLIGRAHPELAGIEWLRFSIVTPETEAKEAKKDGLVWKELRTKVESRLKEASIEIGHPWIYDGLEPMPLGLKIGINMLKLKDSQQYVFRIQTSLARAVHLTKDSSWVIPADVWKKASQMQTVSIRNMPPTITKVVLEQVDSFIADYRIANPPGKHPADANDIAALITVPTRQIRPPVKLITAEHEYVASKNSKVFHKPDCSSAKRIKPANLVTYSTREKAIEAGKRPCKLCKP